MAVCSYCEEHSHSNFWMGGVWLCVDRFGRMSNKCGSEVVSSDSWRLQPTRHPCHQPGLKEDRAPLLILDASKIRNDEHRSILQVSISDASKMHGLKQA